MGSSHFYLEFLLALVYLLRTSPTSTHQFQNPAVFALDYTLVPDGTYPVQLQQTLAGYNHLLSILPDSSRICLAGDSAGATLHLSLLLHLSRKQSSPSSMRPGFAMLISPWATLFSFKNQDTRSDYLSAASLQLYAKQYVGGFQQSALWHGEIDDAVISPGTCKDKEWWHCAAPTKGLAVFYGSEEVLATETSDLIELLRQADVDVVEREEYGGIHAWPVATLFLSDSREERLKGLEGIVDLIGERMG